MVEIHLTTIATTKNVDWSRNVIYALLCDYFCIVLLCFTFSTLSAVSFQYELLDIIVIYDMLFCTIVCYCCQQKKTIEKKIGK